MSELNEVEKHWTGWAREFEEDLRATTKTRTIKDLEIAEFLRVFRQSPMLSKSDCTVLEVGCGNGHNCFGWSPLIPHFDFTGVDFAPEMVANAPRRLRHCLARRARNRDRVERPEIERVFNVLAARRQFIKVFGWKRSFCANPSGAVICAN